MNAAVERVSTFGMTEVLYLLERGHAITDVDIAPSWPCGIEDLRVTLEGTRITSDHESFLRQGAAPHLTRLALAFEAVTEAVRRKAERGAP